MAALPLDLLSVTAAFAALGSAARAAGGRIAAAAAGALSAELGVPVTLTARALPSSPAAPLGTERLVVELADGAQVVADVEARLGCALAALLGAGNSRVASARRLSPAERAAVELLALVALAGARTDPECAALAPVLVREQRLARAALAVSVDVVIGDVSGWVRLAVPRSAVTALEDGARREDSSVVPDVRIGAALCRGAIALTREEAASLAVGDVVLLEPGAELRHELLFDGGVSLAGEVEGDVFTVKERTMQQWNGGFPLTLSLEIARVTIALRDLARVEPGGVLPLGVARDGAVTLRAGDSVVGRGELVDVDGVLGVRITAWEDGR